MIKAQGATAWVIGLALFSMFFGSGNLIFPMAVGAFAEEHYLYGTFGFLITAVLLPFLGVFTMVLFKGDYVRFFAILSKPLGFIVTLLLLTFWIPLGSGPRCVTLAYAAMQTYLSDIPLWIFSLIYCLAIFAMTYRENRIITILGKILTPALLIAILVIFIAGLYFSPGLAPVTETPSTVFWYALAEGYNTQDLIASFFFSSAIIGILQHTSDENKKIQKSQLALVLRSGLIGVIILGVVYLGLLYLGATYSSILEGVPKDVLLPRLSIYLLGHHLGFLPVIIVALACITTSVALTLVFANFLKDSIFHNRISHEMAVAVTTLITFGTSLIGFEGISLILGSAMNILYPTLLVLIIVNLVVFYLKKPDTIGTSQSE